jgi:hypothetical protein
MDQGMIQALLEILFEQYAHETLPGSTLSLVHVTIFTNLKCNSVHTARHSHGSSYNSRVTITENKVQGGSGFFGELD